MAPHFTQLDHVSVIITDVEASRRFYRDVLGLKEIPKPRTFDFVVLWFDLGNMHVHLLLKDRPDTISGRHFALRVADVAAGRGSPSAGRRKRRRRSPARIASSSPTRTATHRNHRVVRAIRSGPYIGHAPARAGEGGKRRISLPAAVPDLTIRRSVPDRPAAPRRKP